MVISHIWQMDIVPVMEYYVDNDPSRLNITCINITIHMKTNISDNFILILRALFFSLKTVQEVICSCTYNNILNSQKKLNKIKRFLDVKLL